jgi:hypothetical protein
MVYIAKNQLFYLDIGAPNTLSEITTSTDPKVQLPSNIAA